MLDNIIAGPICCYADDSHCRAIINELIHQNWLPLYRLTKGDLLDGFKQQMPEQQKKITKGLIITVGYFKLYEA